MLLRLLWSALSLVVLMYRLVRLLRVAAVRSGAATTAEPTRGELDEEETSPQTGRESISASLMLLPTLLVRFLPPLQADQTIKQATVRQTRGRREATRPPTAASTCDGTLLTPAGSLLTVPFTLFAAFGLLRCSVDRAGTS